MFSLRVPKCDPGHSAALVQDFPCDQNFNMFTFSKLQLQHDQVLKTTTSNTLKFHADLERLMDKILHQFAQPLLPPHIILITALASIYVVAYALESFSILCAGVYKGLQIKLVQDFVHQLSAENIIQETIGEDALLCAQIHFFHKPRFQCSDPRTKPAALAHTNTHVHILRAVWLLAQVKL